MVPCLRSVSLLVTETWAQTPKPKVICPQLLNSKSLAAKTAVLPMQFYPCRFHCLSSVSDHLCACDKHRGSHREVSIFHLTEYTLILGFTVLPWTFKSAKSETKACIIQLLDLALMPQLQPPLWSNCYFSSIEKIRYLCLNNIPCIFQSNIIFWIV